MTAGQGPLLSCITPNNLLMANFGGLEDRRCRKPCCPRGLWQKTTGRGLPV